MKTVKWTMLTPEEKLSMKVSPEKVFFIFINEEEVWNTLNREEAEYYFNEFKVNPII